MKKEQQDGAGTGDCRLSMVYEKSERPTGNMIFGRTSYQQGGKVPTGYLERFLGEGLEATGSPDISPNPPFTLSFAFPSTQLSASQCPRQVSSSLAWHRPPVSLHTHLPLASAQTPSFRKAFLRFLCSSAYVFSLVLFLPDIIQYNYLLACLSCCLECKCICTSR